MKLTIVCAGRALAAHEQAWVSEYIRRAKKYAHVDVLRLKDAATISQKIPKNSFVILLDEKGESMSTDSFRRLLEKAEREKKGNVTIVIGGAYGVKNSINAHSDRTISFGAITLPHRLALLVLVEQIYRVLSWRAGAPYHHE